MKGIFKYLIALTFWFVVFLIIRNIYTGFFCDTFHLSNFSKEKTHDFFKLICEITATIFSILMAVISLGYELLGNSARRRKRFSVLNETWVACYTSLAVTVILVSLYSAFSIDNLNQPNDLTTAYLTGNLFALFVVLLFPFTIWLLSLSDTLKTVKQWIKENPKDVDYSEDIIDELIYYIKEEDRVAYKRNILPLLTENTLEYLGDASNRNEANALFTKLTNVWTVCNEEAWKTGEAQYFYSVWKQIQSIYTHAAKNKSFLLHFQELEDFTRVQIEFLASHNIQDGLTSAAKVFSEIYLHQLQFNCPEQETIRDLYWANEDRDAPNPHPDADLQWDNINNILWEIHQLQKVAIDLKSKHLFETVKFELGSILFNLRYRIKLGNYQERFIVFQIFSFQTYYAQLALESGMFKSAYEAFHFSSFEISDYVREQKIFAGDIIKRIEDYLLYCQKNNYLDEEISVRDLGGLGRLITMEYVTNPVAQVELLSVVEILSKLKTEIQKQANYLENKNYLEIKKELESFKVQLEKVKDNSSAANTISRIDEVLNTYIKPKRKRLTCPEIG